MGNADIFDELEACARDGFWPFKDMKVGDVVDFPKELKRRAAGSAGGYAKAYGMKFKQRTDRATGTLYIKRIA